jgi:ankyrin repeat protein
MISEMVLFLILGLIVDGSEDFWKAVKEGDLPRVQSLVAASPSLAALRTDKRVSAPLLALYYQKLEVADFLASRKDAVDPLDVFEAAAFGRTERLKAILDREASLANAYASDGFYPLGLAAFYGHEEAAKLLLAKGADPNLAARNAMKVRAIHAASASGSLSIVRALLEAGADVNALQEKGFTPLHEAAATGKLELLRLLLDHGANAELQTEDGKSALDLARDEKEDAIVELLTRRSGGR